MTFSGASENCDFEVFGVSPGLVDIIFGVFGAQLRKSNGLLHGAKHSPPSLEPGEPKGQKFRFQHFM